MNTATKRHTAAMGRGGISWSTFPRHAVFVLTFKIKVADDYVPPRASGRAARPADRTVTAPKTPVGIRCPALNPRLNTR